MNVGSFIGSFHLKIIDKGFTCKRIDLNNKNCQWRVPVAEYCGELLLQYIGTSSIDALFQILFGKPQWVRTGTHLSRIFTCATRTKLR